MAGVKGRSGGARPNSGPKPKPKTPPAASNDDDPLTFLRRVWKGELVASPEQIRAATAALPFVHRKVGESGKKEQRGEAAQGASKGRFAAATPPKLVASAGKKVT